jgi:hypothetical protein
MPLLAAAVITFFFGFALLKRTAAIGTKIWNWEFNMADWWGRSLQG